MPHKILLDTDIGTDVDDALCLAYLLTHRAFDLLGITTVTGDVQARARIARAMCERVGRDTPIHAGRREPLLGPCRQPRAPHAAVLDNEPADRALPEHDAIAFLAQQIRRHPGEVTLLAIGPLTNIAALFLAFDDTPALLRSLVLMGGNFFTLPRSIGGSRLAEWNIWNDPHAAAVVMNAPVPHLRLCPLDVTRRVTMTARQARQRLTGGPHGVLDLVARFAEVWFERMAKVTFHDPLTAVTVAEPDTCGYERGRVEIELASPRLIGVTHWEPDPLGPHEVALDVQPQRFFEHYFAPFTVPSEPMTPAGR